MVEFLCAVFCWRGFSIAAGIVGGVCGVFRAQGIHNVLRLEVCASCVLGVSRGAWSWRACRALLRVGVVIGPDGGLGKAMFWVGRVAPVPPPAEKIQNLEKFSTYV